MESPSRGPSTCVALVHLRGGGGDEDAACFTHTCLGGGQRWDIPCPAASAWELLLIFAFPQSTLFSTALIAICLSIILFNRKLALKRRASSSLFCVWDVFISSHVAGLNQNPQKCHPEGELFGMQPGTCSFCRYVTCGHYTSFALQQERFRARTLGATTAAPPHAVLWASLLCVSSAAEKGVCSDVNAVYLSLLFPVCGECILSRSASGFVAFLYYIDEDSWSFLLCLACPHSL